jgi:two-component system, OmpR family, sensor histidine kinase BaeS
MMWGDVLGDRTGSAKDRAEALAAIRQCTAEQSRLLGDLRDVSRALADSLVLDRRPIEVGSVLAAVLADLELRARARGVALVRPRAANLGALAGDPLRLGQALDRLTANALQRTPAGGRVTVRTRRAGAITTIAISNTGTGFTAERLRALFDPFAQAEAVLRQGRDGLEIGLVLARALLRRHRGTLGATSRGPSSGATFTVTLPTRVERRVRRRE